MTRIVSLMIVTSLAVGCGSLAPQSAGDAGSDAGKDVVEQDGDAMEAADVVDASDASDVAPVVEVFGAACASDADCATGLVCWNKELATANGASKWPAHGVCTAKCTSDASCDAQSKGSSCKKITSSSELQVCFPGCDPASGPFFTRFDLGTDPMKCGGRKDLACLPNGEHSYCMPTCNDDSACAPARCGATGFCTNEDVGDWSDIGKDPGPGSSECSLKNVLATVGGGSIFTARCTLGVVPSCGWAGPASGKPANALCMDESATKIGDNGFCFEACDCDSDCRGKGVYCVALDIESAKLTGRKGVCSSAGGAVPGCG
jgi:hypothetical protein